MLKCLANIILRMGGWKILGEIPSIPQAVFLAAPHTSNWDGFWLLVYKVAIDLDVRFLAKDTLFWWPLSSVLRALGAMSLDRDDASGIVLQLVRAFEQQDSLFLALAPEGTRGWRPQWKTGFHRISSAAGVPIVLARIDYDKREIGIGPTLPPGRSLEQDFNEIRAYYIDVRGRHPEKQGPITFMTE